MVAKQTIYGISMVAKKSMMGFSWFPRTPWKKLVFTTTGKNRLKTYLLTIEEVSGFSVWSWHGYQENHFWYFNCCQEIHDGFFMVPKNTRSYWTELVFLLNFQLNSVFNILKWSDSTSQQIEYILRTYGSNLFDKMVQIMVCLSQLKSLKIWSV